MNQLSDIDDSKTAEIEAAVFRKMVAHFRKYPEVQNIDLMNLSYFCRNCLAKWYMGAAHDKGVALDYSQAREIIYGMPFDEYKHRHQGKATEAQLAQFEKSSKKATE